MIASFNDIFNSNNKLEKKIDEIFKRAMEKCWCCTCLHYEYERDGDWCKLCENIADGTCSFYDPLKSIFDN